MLNDAINERIFEFAMDCQRVLENGWKFDKINYGEARLGISPSMVLSKGERTETLYHPDDIGRFILED